jgi:hypothetical protein
LIHFYKREKNIIMRVAPCVVVVCLAVSFYASAVQGLMCKIGVSFVTKEVDCSGSWDTLKSKLSGMAGLGNVTSLDFGSMFSKAVSSATSNSRKKRQSDTTMSPSTSAAQASTTQDPSKKYYCLTHEFAGAKIRSCAPESLLGISDSLCMAKDNGVKNCACDDALCNTGSGLLPGKLAMVVSSCGLLFLSLFL